MGLFSMPRFSNWRITGSAGASVSVGTNVIVMGVGYEDMRLPLANDSTGEEIALRLSGIEVECGVGFVTPLSVDLALRCFPSDGIGRIIAGCLAPSELISSSFNETVARAWSITSPVSVPIPHVSLVAIGFYNLPLGIVSSLHPSLLDNIALARCGGLFYASSGRMAFEANVRGFVGYVRDVLPVVECYEPHPDDIPYSTAHRAYCP